MKRTTHNSRRQRGAILVLTVLLLVPMICLVALAIDIGMVAVARTQAQNAADAAAMSGARALHGDPNTGYGKTDAATKALNSATNNYVMGSPVTTGNVTIETGQYNYNDATEKFYKTIDNSLTNNLTLVKATVQHESDYAFARIFTASKLKVRASAVSVHRPRDVAVVMDFSGSMRFDSLLGIPYTGNRTKSNNPDTEIPDFGHYSATSTAALVNSNSVTLLGGEVYGSAPYTTATANGTPIIEDFLAAGSGQAFTRQPSSYATTPDGDIPLRANSNSSGGGYARTLSEALKNNNTTVRGDSDWETNGYQKGWTGIPVTSFVGYTRGPGYYGKTFYIWPPDPRTSKDWRGVFFYKRNLNSGLASACDNNTLLWDSSGNWRTPGTVVSIAGVNHRYEINYSAILNWIKNSGANPFPDSLQTGRILYYASIPSTFTTIDSSTFPPTFPDSPADQAARDERFWKDYIDYVLGLNQPTSGAAYTNIVAKTGYGGMFTYNLGSSTYNVRISTKPTAPWQYDLGLVRIDKQTGSGYAAGTTTGIHLESTSNSATLHDSSIPVVGDTCKIGSTTYSITGVTTLGSGHKSITISPGLAGAVADNTAIQLFQSTAPYMDYRDTPLRPRLHFWFGPLSLVDFLGNYNAPTWSGSFSGTGRFWFPGNVHESPLWQCKIGIQAALDSIRVNHPNDRVALIFFSSPRYSSSDNNVARRFNRVRAPMGQNYQRMIDSLWFPLYTIDNPGTTISPFDTTPSERTIQEAPNAKGSTCYPMALMLAYNQFSSNVNLRNYATTNGLASAPEGDAGGLGRRGAARLVIFETDGMVNTPAQASLANQGAGNSYYAVRQPVEFPSNSGDYLAQTYGIVDQICALETAALPGYSTPRKPVVFHCIAFGTLFEEISSSDPDQASALTVLQTMQFKGAQAGGEQTTTSTPLASYKRITGTDTERISKLQTAFEKIMNDAVQVTLIE